MKALKSSLQSASYFSDIIGGWIILGAASVAISVLFDQFLALRKSKARLLIKIWGRKIIGGVCAFVAMHRSISIGGSKTQKILVSRNWRMTGV